MRKDAARCRRSALFWLEQELAEIALARWSMLLRTWPEASAQLFPLLARSSRNSATRPLLQPTLADPPGGQGPVSSPTRL